MNIMLEERDLPGLVRNRLVLKRDERRERLELPT